MKMILAIFFLVSICASAQTGFFLITDNKGHCDQLLPVLNNIEKYCVTEEPIIKKSEFRVVSDVQNDPNQKNGFFYIRFTKNGFETLKLICEHLPEKQLVLVVSGQVVGLYQNKNLKPMEVMPINGTKKDLTWIHQQLTKQD